MTLARTASLASLAPYRLVPGADPAMILHALALSLGPVQVLGPPITSGAQDAASITAAVATDLNGDGTTDFLWTDFGGGNVGWAPGLGGGAFDGAQTLSLDTIESFVQAYVGSIDVDGDGDEDIVYAAENVFGHGVRWIENLGAERFAAYAPLPGGPGEVSGLAVFDVDGDGDDDLVLIEGSFGATSLHWMEWGPGAGLAPAVLRIPLPGQPYEPKGRDMDGDGVLDLVWRDGSSQRIFWSRSLAGGSSGPPQVLVPGVGGFWEFDVLDVEGDGDQDVIGTLNGTPLGVFLNDGALGFTAAPVTLVGGGFTELWGGDLDGDGDMDLVTLVASVQQSVFAVHENVGGLTFAAPTTYDLGTVQVNSGEVGATDLDGDGDLDPWAANRGIVWRPNDGGGGFGSARPLAEGLLPPGYRAANAGDVDGDGRPEVVTASVNGLVIARNYPGEAAFIEEIPVPGRPNMAPIVVDMDGDGDLDVLVATSGAFTPVLGQVALLENDGGVQPPVSLTGAFGRYVRAQPGDADGDGRMDVFVEWLVSGNAELDHAWWIQTPGGGFQQGPLLGQPGYELLRTGDVDGDGRADVLAARRTGAQTQLLWTHTGPGGSFGPTQTIAFLPTEFTSYDVAELADVDRDGRLDLCVIVPTQGLRVALGQAGGGFGPLTLVAPSATLLGKELAVGDVDLDGHLDVVSRDSTTLLFFAGDGQGGFASPAPQAQSNGFSSNLSDLVLVDVDGDHDLDVLRFGATNIVVHLGTSRLGRGYCQAETVGSTGLRPRVHAAGSAVIADNDLTLGADQLPPGEFGIFLMSPNRDHLPATGGAGTLCLGQGLARFQRPGEVRQADAAGTVSLAVDLGALPAPASVAQGSTRYFQYWTRDRIGGVPTSNFTGALSLGFR